MNIPKHLRVELLLLLLIVAIGVGSRFWLLDWPNFKPVAALCLFGGFLFRRYLFAVAAGVLILLISDWQLGGYSWQISLAVYGSMLIACGLGWRIKKRSDEQLGTPLKKWQLGGFAISSLIMSAVFFVSTNMAVWCFAGWYSPGLAGLAECFYAAIPFFRWTLLSDLFFTGALVAVYQAVCLFAENRLTAMITE